MFLCHVTRRTGAECAHGQVLVAEVGRHQNGYRRDLFAEVADERDTIHLGHVNVGHDRARNFSSDGFERLAAIARLRHRVTGLQKDRLQLASLERTVVHNQNRRHRSYSRMSIGRILPGMRFAVSLKIATSRNPICRHGIPAIGLTGS